MCKPSSEVVRGDGVGTNQRVTPPRVCFFLITGFDKGRSLFTHRLHHTVEKISQPSVLTRGGSDPLSVTQRGGVPHTRRRSEETFDTSPHTRGGEPFSPLRETGIVGVVRSTWLTTRLRGRGFVKVWTPMYYQIQRWWVLGVFSKCFINLLTKLWTWKEG